jgi:hypothetical protein
MPKVSQNHMSGSTLVIRCLSTVREVMDVMEFAPFQPLVVGAYTATIEDVKAVTAGSKHSVKAPSLESSSIDEFKTTYRIPASCETKHFRKPC